GSARGAQKGRRGWPLAGATNCPGVCGAAGPGDAARQWIRRRGAAGPVRVRDWAVIALAPVRPPVSIRYTAAAHLTRAWSWARGVQAGSARVAGCVFESLRSAGAERDEGRAPEPPRAANRRTTIR